MKSKPAIDTRLLVKDAAGRLDLPTRRAFLRNAVGLGSLTLLTGCDVTTDTGAESFLKKISTFNDWAQAKLFDPNQLARIGAGIRAPYVSFRCFDGYSTSIDMAAALHLQTQLTLGFGDGVLPRKHGFPLKLRVPPKLRFKNPKHIGEIAVTDEYKRGFWEDYGYNWFSGL
jgi:hypothetical protein